jgi:hypothetical protein
VLESEGRLARVAVRQHGAFTRAQAAAAGLSASQLQRRVSAGAWVRMFPRVYRHAAVPPNRALVLSAALLWAGPGAALSHTTAAGLWRIGNGTHLVELLVPRTRAPRAPGVLVHRVASVEPVDVASWRGFAVTTPVRTLIDLAAVLAGPELGAAVRRAAALGLVTRGSLEARLGTLGGRGRPGTARLREFVRASYSAPRDLSARMAG